MNRRGREAIDHQISPIYQAAVGFCGFCSILKKNRSRGSPSSFIIGFLQRLDGENDLLVETFSWGLDIFATCLPWNTIFAGCNCGEPNTGIRHCKKKKSSLGVTPNNCERTTLEPIRLLYIEWELAGFFFLFFC